MVVQAPEHVVENEQALAKAGDDPKARRKVVRKKPPEGFVSWGKPTFERLVAADPEPLTSSFKVTHAMVLNVIARPGDAFAAMRHLLTDNHEDRSAQRRHIHQAIAIYRALLAGGVVERLDEPDEEGRLVRLTVDLQFDFALNQPLSPFALAAIDLLDRESPSYSLDVLSVIESTLENPRQVLSAQQFRARGEAVAQMKADGVGYEERLELLDDVTYPKPLEDLLDGAYEIYRRGHPWVADYEVRPKSVVRDMYERALTFAEYVAFYGLSRSEGLVLRYLADAYKALRQTVPDEAKTEDLTDLIEWLGEIIRQVDSSLIDEWERLRNPLDAAEPARDERPAMVTSNVRAFRVLVRNALFHRVRLAALGHYEELGALDSESGWDAAAWEDAVEDYFEVHDDIGIGPDARGPALLIIDADQPGQWAVRQIIDDPAGDHDWGISAVVDLDASDEAGSAVLRITDVGQLSGFRRLAGELSPKSGRTKRAVRGQGEAGIPGDLPDVAVRVAETAGVAAVEGFPGRLRYLGPRAGRVGQHRVGLGSRPDVVRQDDAVEVARAAIGHAAVIGQLGPPPQDQGHAPGLEEDGLLGFLAVPAEALVEGPGPADVGDAERDQADALLHQGNLTEATRQ